jgi:2,4-dichlorophenol 6-monooxygenase
VTGSPQAQDLYYEWQRIREIEETGALLVRPDGVVAWRERGAAKSDDDAAEKLGAALSAVLDLASLAGIKQIEKTVLANGSPALFA